MQITQRDLQMGLANCIKLEVFQGIGFGEIIRLTQITFLANYHINPCLLWSHFVISIGPSRCGSAALMCMRHY